MNGLKNQMRNSFFINVWNCPIAVCKFTEPQENGVNVLSSEQYVHHHTLLNSH